MVYNFSLLPLVLLSFYAAPVVYDLYNWTKTSKNLSLTTFLNFLDSHDGIGILRTREFLSDKEIQNSFDRILDYSGSLSFKLLFDGSQKFYEMNSIWWSAINKKGEDSLELQFNKFATSRAIVLTLARLPLPVVYYLSLFSKENDVDHFKETGIKQKRNHSTLNLRELILRLKDNNSSDLVVFRMISSSIEKRKKTKAFHPNATQKILSLGKPVFSFVREFKNSKVLALQNASSDLVEVKYNNKSYRLTPYGYQ